RDLALVAPFVAEDQRRLVVPEAQQVLREVELHVREPACAGHPVAIDQRGFKVTAGADAAELPHQRPELLRMADGEIVERLVAADVGIASGLAHETNKPM